MKLTQYMILTPDQALQVGVEHEALPDEFLMREGDSHGPHVLRRQDRVLAVGVDPNDAVWAGVRFGLQPSK